MSETDQKADANKSAEELEREIAAERGELAHTIEELKGRLSIGGAIDQINTAFRDFSNSSEGGNLVRRVQDTARDNPLPLALIGAGIALFAVGGGPSSRRIADGAQDVGTRARMAGEQARDRLSSDDDAYADLYDEDMMGDDPFIVGGVRDGRPRDAMTGEPIGVPADSASIEAEKRSRREAVRERLRSLGGSGEELSAEMRERRERARRRAEETAEDARRRAQMARDELGYRVRRGGERARRAGHEASRQAQGFLHDNPLAAGAIALAVGALAGAALPQSEIEDRRIGDDASRLRGDLANRAVEEARRARRVAEAATREALEAFGDEARAGMERSGGGRDAVQEAEARAAGIGERVASAAETEAERQDLGANAPQSRTG
ncbi:MAG: DUF3618 domain-containing protein [Paracoccaceae bacterium]